MPIPTEVADLLADRRFGITFPCASGCQMRFIHERKDYGQFYSYAKHGGVRKAVLQAIKDNQALCARYRRRISNGRPSFRVNETNRSNTGVNGVTGSSYFDSRRQKTYFRYQARWQDSKGKARIRSFMLVEPSTADQKLHTLRTAIHFRKQWEQDLDQFQPQRYQLWKSRRLYEAGHPLLPDDFWQI